MALRWTLFAALIAALSACKQPDPLASVSSECQTEIDRVIKQKLVCDIVSDACRASCEQVMAK